MEEELPSIFPRVDLVPAGVRSQLFRLQSQLDALVREKVSGMRTLDDETFSKLTGFRSVREAEDEFEKVGGDAAFSQIKRHGTPIAGEALDRVMEVLNQQMPDLHEPLAAARTEVFSRRVNVSERISNRGRPELVDQFHCFLLVFAYVHGGVLEFQAPFIPGLGVTESHFSRLLNVFTPVVAAQWASLYYRQRDLAWMCKNCAPTLLKTSETAAHDPHDPDLLNAHIVLAFDGGTVKCEKSQGGREQKENYDWLKDKQNEVRVIIVSSLSGAIVDMNSAMGGRKKEVEVVTAMEVLERLAEEAAEGEDEVRVHLLLDRGFYDFAASVRAEKWGKLTVTIGMPLHLNAPIGRGRRRKKDEPPEKKRKQHEVEEVLLNRQVASERWINEWSVGQLKNNRLFKRLLDLSIAHHIDDFLSIAAALVNLRIGIKAVHS